MLTLLFAFMMLMVLGKMIAFSFRAAWGLTKCLLFLVLFPVTLIGIFVMGFVYLALPILILAFVIVTLRSVF